MAPVLLEEAANSPTIEPPSGQPRNWRTITKEVLTLMQKFQPLRQTSQPVDLAKGLRIPRESDFEGQWYLVTELPWTGKIETPG